MRARVDHATLVDHRDALGQPQRRTPVSDEDRGAVGHEVAQRVVDRLLGRGIDRRRGVVEHEDPRIGEDRSGQRDALALAAGQREPALAHHRVVAVGQRVDEGLRTTGSRRGADLFVGRVGIGVGDVGAHGVREQEGVLEDHADLAAQRGRA